jgi:hypothetical protein
MRELDGEPFGRQPTLQGPGQAAFVLYYQNPHVASLSRLVSWWLGNSQCPHSAVGAQSKGEHIVKE